jgi:hypothetical protein
MRTPQALFTLAPPVGAVSGIRAADCKSKALTLLSTLWAGWWHALVSAPVALVLLLGWLWRILSGGFFFFEPRALFRHTRILPAGCDLSDLIALIVVTLLPFLPALLFEIPVNEILADLIKVMF